jgi:hypothetical protein
MYIRAVPHLLTGSALRLHAMADGHAGTNCSRLASYATHAQISSPQVQFVTQAAAQLVRAACRLNQCCNDKASSRSMSLRNATLQQSRQPISRILISCHLPCGHAPVYWRVLAACKRAAGMVGRQMSARQLRGKIWSTGLDHAAVQLWRTSISLLVPAAWICPV